MRERECVGHSRCSWDETVRLTGRGKKVAGTGVVEGEVGSEVAVVEVDLDDAVAVAGDCGLEEEEEEEEEGNAGFCRRNTSPAPSQSELVIIGVWTWTNSFSCTSVSLRQARRCWTPSPGLSFIARI